MQKALSHGAIFLATCNAILLLRDANKFLFKSAVLVRLDSSVRLLLWTQIHAASTRRAISTRHAWICIPNLASLSTFPRGVHAARQKHVPCVERISFLRVPHPPECVYPTQRSRKGPTRFNEARACSVPCVTLGPRVYCPAPTRTRE